MSSPVPVPFVWFIPHQSSAVDQQSTAFGSAFVCSHRDASHELRRTACFQLSDDALSSYIGFANSLFEAATRNFVLFFFSILAAPVNGLRQSLKEPKVCRAVSFLGL